MKKFFKILGIVFGFIIIIGIGFSIYLYFWNKDRIQTTKELSEKIENFESKNSEEYMEYSVHLNKAGDFEKGFTYLNKAVELEPEMHLGYRGWIRLRKIRDFDKALADFDRLDSLTPKFVDAPWGENIDFLRGECYFGKKDYQKAIESFNLNVKHNKEDWVDIHTFVYLGLCEYKLGNYEKAISEFERALAQSEYTTESSFGISKAYYKLGNIEKAKENILEAEKNIDYKRDDAYNEFLNEIYLSEILEFKEQLEK
ncbi:tetratricopeptide repeat protein [Polaribacter sp. Q13]|uniref:tetratricopeptide repeat protein n=1 Tax=Polaribacter sp. Q13 TaxID=2806551 RepID=UPI00193BD466|nr:tetratricopeptide repeat protein [Polaribacter sp. Q13]QVY66891.1 tetratricopeptide repeat protein [Polaribacter sp. Q13]